MNCSTDQLRCGGAHRAKARRCVFVRYARDLCHRLGLTSQTIEQANSVPAILTSRELATVLAALRHVQQGDRDDEETFEAAMKSTYPDHFADEVPLSLAQIDALCESSTPIGAAPTAVATWNGADSLFASAPVGHSSAEIAGLLHISVRTVDAHRLHVMDKLGIRSIAELKKFAIRNGLSTV